MEIGEVSHMFQFDIFLSHSAADSQDADRVRAMLLQARFRVYCDRYDDPLLDLATCLPSPQTR